MHEKVLPCLWQQSERETDAVPLPGCQNCGDCGDSKLPAAVQRQQDRLLSMANRTDWNERTEITKAVITWFDADYEYELEIENEDRMDNEEFTAWVEENAESLAKADAEENGTTFEEIDSIDFTEKEIDDDALFDEEYENACEFEWECQTGR